jgi:hypothetical protein
MLKYCRNVHYFELLKGSNWLQYEKLNLKFCEIEILTLFCTPDTVDVVQLVRTSDCGSEGRGFEPHLPP